MGDLVARLEDYINNTDDCALRVDAAFRIRQLEADYDSLARDLAACKIARDGFTAASDTAHARIRELESRISEGERLFKKMLMMSGSELGGPHPIWADVERWLYDPPISQSDRGSK